METVHASVRAGENIRNVAHPLCVFFCSSHGEHTSFGGYILAQLIQTHRVHHALGAQEWTGAYGSPRHRPPQPTTGRIHDATTVTVTVRACDTMARQQRSRHVRATLVY
jgi:hypothetical protein